MNKKLLLLFLLFFSQYTYSQCTNDCVSRAVLAGLIYEVVYDQNDPDDYQPMVDYPIAFVDLNFSTTLQKKISLVSYLDYNDGVTVLGHLAAGDYLLTTGAVGRTEAIVALLEAWNIQPDYTGTVTFNDVDSSHPYFGYINEADDLDLLDGLFGSNLNGDFGITTNELLTIINRIQNTDYHPVSNSALLNPNNYFTPNNYQPENMGFLRGLEQGVFSHYAKNSFVIPDRKMSLNFSHYYSTQLVELPQSYFPIQPLGRGWTHTYNSYIIREENVIGNDDLYYIKWSDGTIHIYNDNENEYLTKGVYDDLDEFDGGDNIEITTKDQMHYFFERLDNSLEIFYLYRIEDSNGNVINIEYETSDVDNDLERIKWVEAPSGKKLRFYYHNNTDFIDYIEDPIDRIIRFEYNEERLKKFYDAKNQRTKYFYVSNDEDIPDQHQYKRFLLRKVKLPLGNTIEASYDEDDDGKLKEYQINDNPAVGVDVQFDYSNSSTPMTAELEVPMPNTGNTQQFNYEFNVDGMVTEFQNDTQDIDIEYPSPTNTNALLPTNIDVNGLDTYYTYDDKGNVKSRRIESNEDEDFWYDNDNNLIRYRDENGNETRFNYDNNSNLTSIEDALGNFIYLTYDNHGQLTSITNQEGITVNYTYEDDGAVSTITAPEDLTSSFTYDGVNRMLSKTINGQTSSYNYDANDNLLTHTNIGGLTTSFNYDANDNLIEIINANNVSTLFTYNEDDQVTSETFGSLVKQYEYNENGTLDNYIKPSGDVIHYDYLSNGKLNDAGTITDIDYYGSSGGKKEGLIKSIASSDVRYNLDYDYLNRLDEVENDETNEKVKYDYDDVGNITEIEYPNADIGDDVKVFYTYDAKNRLTRVRVRINGNYTTIADYQYRQDDLVSNILYGNGVRTIFFYDEAGRRTGVNHVGPADNPLYKEAVTIDDRGNITNQDVEYEVSYEHLHFSPNKEEQNFSYNENNHIDGSYAFNDDGNLVSDGYASHVYNIDDQLISRTASGESFVFEYDAYGNRVLKTDTPNLGTRRYIWDIIGQNIIQELNVNGAGVRRNHVYGLGLEASILPAGGILYYHGDLRGNVVIISNSDAEEYRDYIYDDFGNTRPFSVGHIPDHNSFTFLGKYGIVEDDRDKGLYYIRARYYDARIGRFLTQDPIWSTNLYPYSGNNPISRIDVNGKDFKNILNLAEASGLDAVSINASAGFAAPVGISLGLSSTYILSGEDKSSCPIISGSFQINGGVYAGADIGISGQEFTGEGGYQKEFINSNLFQEEAASISLDLAAGGFQAGKSEPNGIGNGNLYEIGASYGPGLGFHASTTGERILLDTNRVRGFLNFFGLDKILCR
ncbi:RHS repeat-associated core domain-containing protein [uncultured Kordia sp.]|uniref:RHS repeat-associated core domain-containing protein n=1 Tax=uncultured Kordia sp. TaxID=507699 RepID=UPI00263714D8|nr:RHS repeat-associated core domain-containing protein [uncultured Kordia sp.]